MEKRIQIVLDHIEENLSLGFSLDGLASHACMSPSYFHRVFKKATGQTPFRYIEEKKLESAFQQLVAGDATVAELTGMYGYNDYETFSRSFKKHFAIAPDDLKAIYEKIMSVEEIGADDLVLRTFAAEDLNAVNNFLKQIPMMLEQIIKDRGLTAEDLRDSKFLAVLPKEIDEKISRESPHVVKNKFVVHLEKDLLKELNKLSDDD